MFERIYNNLGFNGGTMYVGLLLWVLCTALAGGGFEQETEITEEDESFILALADQVTETWSTKYKRLQNTIIATTTKDVPGSGSTRAWKLPQTVTNLTTVQKNLFQKYTQPGSKIE